MVLSDNTFGHIKERLKQVIEGAKQHCEAVESIIYQLGSLDGRQDEENLAGQLRNALEKLEGELQTPVVRIAAIGSTSSAKSSLLNFLCGANLLPTGVQEKSAGVVRVINSPDISLQIEKTDGALWPCEIIEVSTAEEIAGYLDEIMTVFRDAVNADEELEAPSAIIKYPIRLAGELDLPPGFQLELMDLPGLKFTGDERNLRVMRQCADALCLVAIGSQETDPLRQAAMVEEALDQVNAIGSPIERMLFVITRVDEFLLNEPADWPKNEDEYVNDRMLAIIDELNKKMPDKEINAIVMGRISPMPALCSLQLADANTRLGAYDSVRRKYFGLVLGGRNRDRDSGIDPAVDLSSPKYKLWNEEDWAAVSEQLLETSGALEFMNTLRTHIADNLLSIVLPPAQTQYATTAEEVSRQIKDRVNLLKVRISEDFQGQMERLGKTGQELKRINENASQRLHEFLEQINSQVFMEKWADDGQIDRLKQTKLSFPEFAVSGLADMSRWPQCMRDAYLYPIRCLKERIIWGKPLPQSLPNREGLERSIQGLMRQGYDKYVAKSGKIMFVEQYNVKQDIENSFCVLNKLCNKSIQASIKDEFAKQTDKMLAALEQVQDAYLRMIDSMMVNVPEEFLYVAQITPQALKKFTMDNSPEVIDIRIAVKTSVRKFKESKTVQNLAQGGIWLFDKITNIARKITGTDTLIQDVEKTEYKVELPSIEKLEKDMVVKFGAFFVEIQKQMLSTAKGQIDTFLDNLRNCQSSRISAYERKLADIMREKRQIVTNQQGDLDKIITELDAADRQLREWRNVAQI